MKCPACGTRLSKGATFCHTCYAPIGVTGAPPPASSAVSTAASPPPVALSAPVTTIAPRSPRAAHRSRTVRLVVAGGLAVALILVALLFTRPWEGGAATARAGNVAALPILSGDGSGGQWRLGTTNGVPSVTSAQVPGCREGPCPGTMTVRFSDGSHTTVDDVSEIAEIGQVDPAHYLAVAGFCYLNCVVRVYGIDTAARSVTTVLDRAQSDATGNPSYFPMPQGACGFTLTYRGATYTVRTVPDKASAYSANWLLYSGDKTCPLRSQYARSSEATRVAVAAVVARPQDTPTVKGMAPTCLALAGAGHLLIGDDAHYVVWLANLTDSPVTLYGQTVAAGGIAPIAGKGGMGFGGDGGPATKATLFIQGGDLAVDKANNLFIADTNNYRIREVDARTGTIKTLAGGPNPYLHATGLNPLSIAIDGGGALLVDDFNHARILKVDPHSGAMTTRATVPPLPRAVAVDSGGDLFVSVGARILKVAAGTGGATTVAGNGTESQGYMSSTVPATAGPVDAGRIVIDHAGHLLLADDYSNVIRTVDLRAGTIATVAGVVWQGAQGRYGGDGGPATEAFLNKPGGLALDSTGNLFIADTGNRRVRLVSAHTGRITTVVGSNGGH